MKLGRVINKLCFLCLLVMTCGCIVGKEVKPVDLREGETSYRYDTVRYTVRRVEVINPVIFSLLDSIIDEKDRNLMVSDSVPFIGSFSMGMDSGKVVVKLALFNDHSQVYEFFDLFYKRNDGAFLYKGKFFFAEVSKPLLASDNYARVLNDSISVYALKLMHRQAEVRYNSLWLYQKYSIDRSKVSLLTSVVDRTPGDFRTE